MVLLSHRKSPTIPDHSGHSAQPFHWFRCLIHCQSLQFHQIQTIFSISQHKKGGKNWKQNTWNGLTRKKRFSLNKKKKIPEETHYDNGFWWIPLECCWSEQQLKVIAKKWNNVTMSTPLVSIPLGKCPSMEHHFKQHFPILKIRQWLSNLTCALFAASTSKLLYQIP